MTINTFFLKQQELKKSIKYLPFLMLLGEGTQKQGDVLFVLKQNLPFTSGSSLIPHCQVAGACNGNADRPSAPPQSQLLYK